MREIVGLVIGAAAGAAGALFVTSAEGKALIERLRTEARPEVERATTEWEPVLSEVARAVRLAARELETATADLRSRIGEIAAEPAPAPDPGPGAADAVEDVPAAGRVDAVAAPGEPPAPASGDAAPEDPGAGATA